MQRFLFLSASATTWILVNALFISGCSSPTHPANSSPSQSNTHLSIAAAANLQFVFKQLTTEFSQHHPEVDIAVTYGSSGNFFAQLSQQAPFDLFFSADTSYPRQLIAAGHAHKDSYRPYANGHIVLWVPKASPLDVEQQQFRTLLDPSVKNIAIANPRLAPYGVAAEEVLRHAKLYETIKDRLVLGESITQTAHFVERGAADIGVLALSLALSNKLKSKGHYWPIPEETHTPITQASVIPTQCRNQQLAKQFQDFVLSAQGQAILAKYGYSTPVPNEETTSYNATPTPATQHESNR